MRLIAKVRRFAGKPPATQLGFLPAWCMLGVARLAKTVIPFRHIARYLGAPADPGAVYAATREQQVRAARIGRLVRMAARYTPWTSDCYPQALVAVLMLRLAGLPYLVTFGLGRGETGSDMLAHCWVTSGATTVCGGTESVVFRPVAAFGSRRALT